LSASHVFPREADHPLPANYRQCNGTTQGSAIM
jgi:hypothetical protein